MDYAAMAIITGACDRGLGNKCPKHQFSLVRNSGGNAFPDPGSVFRIVP